MIRPTSRVTTYIYVKLLRLRIGFAMDCVLRNCQDFVQVVWRHRATAG